MNRDIQERIEKFKLEAHPEGGWFAEVYTAPSIYGTSLDGRPMGGSIYFLLAEKDISHFHIIDCDEIWYYHEGCGVEIWLLKEDGTAAKVLLNKDCPMAVIPKGVIFGAKNTDTTSFTLMSCTTMPAFHYEGFRLLTKKELKEKYPEQCVLIEEMTLA